MNNKMYIGKTSKTLIERKSAHLEGAKYNYSPDNKFHNALRAHPEDKFIWEEIINDPAMSVRELNTLEKKYIAMYDTYKNGYNMTEGGDGGKTYSRGDALYEKIKHKLGKWKNGNPGATPEAIRKRQETFKETTWPTGENHGNFGHSHNVGILAGSKNPMYGKVPPNAIAVSIDGIIYPSLGKASRELGIGTHTIRRKCDDVNNKNFKYV